VGKVHKWAQSSAIPSKFHAAVIAAAKVRGFKVDAALLVDLHAIKPGDVCLRSEDAA
jgi:hypothetical protein